MNTGARFRYQFVAPGDINAFFALAFDNLALLAVLSSILIGAFGMPAGVVLGRMVPGTAMGVLCGDLIYSWLALRLARREQRQDVCAMPFGIDTPSIFALSLGVVGPAFVQSGDAMLAWSIGTAVMVMMGVVKIVAAFFGESLRRVMPAAALIAVLSAVAVALIMFIPFTKLMAEPIGGMVALGVVLLALIGRVRMPRGLPVVPLAVILGALAIWAASFLGYVTPPRAAAGASLGLYLPWPTLGFIKALPGAMRYLPIALPIALVTVIGGVDNTESARLAGDSYRTRSILIGEGVATLIAALCGGVIQNTPYIGHPAYKQMGARAGYTLATGIFIGVGAVTGVIGVVLGALPESLLVPILIYVGIEMAAQATHTTDARHIQALPLALVPVIAYLVNIELGGVLADAHVKVEALPAATQATLQSLQMLGNGFVVSAMVWVALMVFIIDRRALAALLVCVASSAMTLVGLMHSPYSDARLFWPSAATPPQVLALALGYLLLGLLCLALRQRGLILVGPVDDEPARAR